MLCNFLGQLQPVELLLVFPIQFELVQLQLVLVQPHLENVENGVIIVDKNVYSSVSDALNNISQDKLSNFGFTEKIAACCILTDNRYLFVSFAKDNSLHE